MSLPRDRKRHGQRVGIRVGGYCYYSSLTVGTRPTPPLFTRSRWTLGEGEALGAWSTKI